MKKLDSSQCFWISNAITLVSMIPGLGIVAGIIGIAFNYYCFKNQK